MASKAVLLVKLRTLLDEMESPEQEALENKIVEKLPEEFREDFRSLVDNFDADIKFMAYWETDIDCQKAFRDLIQSRMDVVDRLRGVLKELIA